MENIRKFLIFAIVVLSTLGGFQIKHDLDRENEVVVKRVSLIHKIATDFKVSKKDAELYVTQAYDLGKSHQVEPTLLLAIMAVESSFNENAISEGGAMGLMQVMPMIHREKLEVYGELDVVWNPVVNIAVGTSIIREYLMRAKGDPVKALQAYNGNRNSVKYAVKVLTAKARFEEALQA